MDKLITAEEAVQATQILFNKNIKIDPETEYFGADGEIHCKKCNGAVTTTFFKPEILGGDKVQMRCLCECKQKEREDKENQLRLIEKQIRIKDLKAKSLMGKKYSDSSFNKLDLTRPESFLNAYSRTKKYCEAAGVCLEKGFGLYIYGDVGTGKTELTACMANDLMNQGYTVLFTSFSQLFDEIKKTWNKGSTATETDLMKKIANVDFAFFDDIGTEKVTAGQEDTWAQQKIYDIINKRYNSRKPAIFTSNITIGELVEVQGLLQKTVDRIAENSTAILHLVGDSYRMKKRVVNDLPF